ncbi:MAG: hypothetical protein WC843_02905 [Candidatus Gracilibacteria bacterium]|jgi:hypothetical protein
MNLHLSWDLFILVFFAVVIAYSFIIGRNQTLKVILGTYVAILCADGLGNVFDKYVVGLKGFLKVLSFLSIGSEQQAVAYFKVLILLVLVVLIAVRGLFQVEAIVDGPPSARFAELITLGVLSGGLMISAVLVFISGASLIGPTVSSGAVLVSGGANVVAATGGAAADVAVAAGGAAVSAVSASVLNDVYNSSRFIKIMLDYANFWFFLPGLFFIVRGMMHKKA